MNRWGSPGRTGPHTWKYTWRVTDRLALSRAGPVGTAAISKSRGTPARVEAAPAGSVSQGGVRCRPEPSRSPQMHRQKPREAETPHPLQSHPFQIPEALSNSPPAFRGRNQPSSSSARNVPGAVVPSNPRISKYFFRGLGSLMKRCKDILRHSCSLSKSPCGKRDTALAPGGARRRGEVVLPSRRSALSPHQRPTGRQPQAEELATIPRRRRQPRAS